MHHLFTIVCGTAVQGHPRSLIFVAIEMAYGDFLLVTNSNFGPISQRY